MPIRQIERAGKAGGNQESSLPPAAMLAPAYYPLISSEPNSPWSPPETQSFTPFVSWAHLERKYQPASQLYTNKKKKKKQ